MDLILRRIRSELPLVGLGQLRRWLRRLRRMDRVLSMVELIDLLHAIDEQDHLLPRRRRRRIRRTPQERPRRERPSWRAYAQPLVEDGTFPRLFRMGHEDFMILAEMLRPQLRRDGGMGALRNGAVPVEFQLAITLRYLAGGTKFDVMDNRQIAKSTAMAVIHRVVDALNSCESLRCVWPEGDEVEEQARLFQARSGGEVITRAVGAVGGLFARLTIERVKGTGRPYKAFRSWMNGVGMNIQVICNARFEITAWTMNCAGSAYNRLAFEHSGFEKLLRTLPEGCYILGATDYLPSDRVLVPFHPRERKTASMRVYNSHQEHCRSAIDETFGILVRTWGMLWFSCDLPVARFSASLDAIFRLHNFCRRREVDVPPHLDVPMPEDLQFSAEGRVVGGYFDTNKPLRGHVPSDAASPPREAIVARLREASSKYSVKAKAAAAVAAAAAAFSSESCT